MHRSSRSTQWAACVAVLLALVAAPGQVQAQENTVESLKELQELRKEVERRKAELRRELRLLQDVLGEEPRDELVQLAGGTIGGMTPDELAAELRILREEVERLRQSMARERLTAEEDRIAFSGSSRSRFEWTDADFVSGEADVRQLLRTRVRLTARPRHDTRVLAELQDGRLWGEERDADALRADNSLDASGDQIDFHQAYIELQEIYGKLLRLRLGRQELAYGSRRLLGPADWSNPGRAVDAMVLRMGESNWVDLIAAKTAEQGVRDRNLLGLWADVRLAEGHRAGPYALVEQDKRSGPDRLLRATGGTRFVGSVKGTTGHLFGYDLEGAAQVGEIASKDVFAFMASGTLRYRGPSWTEPELRLGVDLMSGDNTPTDGKIKAFDHLLASRHPFFGLMDLFRDIPEDADGGLFDFRLIGDMSAAEAVRVGLHVHHFTRAKAGADGKNLGQEADAVVAYAYSESTTLHWGGAIFVPGTAMKAASGGVDPAFKTWMQLEARF